MAFQPFLQIDLKFHESYPESQTVLLSVFPVFPDPRFGVENAPSVDWPQMLSGFFCDGLA
jgi:hypothetical protein